MIREGRAEKECASQPSPPLNLTYLLSKGGGTRNTLVKPGRISLLRDEGFALILTFASFGSSVRKIPLQDLFCHR